MHLLMPFLWSVVDAYNIKNALEEWVFFAKCLPVPTSCAQAIFIMCQCVRSPSVIGHHLEYKPGVLDSPGELSEWYSLFIAQSERSNSRVSQAWRGAMLSTVIQIMLSKLLMHIPFLRFTLLVQLFTINSQRKISPWLVKKSQSPKKYNFGLIDQHIS